MTAREPWSADVTQHADIDEFGPVDHLVVEFPGSKFNIEIAHLSSRISTTARRADIAKPGSTAGLLVYENKCTAASASKQSSPRWRPTRKEPDMPMVARRAARR